MSISKETPSLDLPSSFQQFYKNAHLCIDAVTSCSPKDLMPNGNMLQVLTKAQMNHHDFIEMQIFELSKEIKSKFGSITLRDKKSILIKAKNISDELERFCSSLKATFIFALFQKYTACLTIVSSMNSCLTGASAKTLPCSKDNLHQTTNKAKQIRAKKQNIKVNDELLLGKETQRRNKLGGVSLYNETYIRHLDNRTSLINAAQLIAEHNMKDEFWDELRRDFKETIGIGTVKEDKNDEKQIITEELNTATKLLNHHSLEKDKSSINFLEGIGISPHRGPDNSADSAYQSGSFSDDIFYSNGRPDPAQKIFEDIMLIYKDEKLSTLRSVKKLFCQFCQFSKKRNKTFIQRLGEQRQKIKQLQQKLVAKLSTCQMSTQTAPIKGMEALLKQMDNLKYEHNKFQIFVESMQEAMRKQSIEISKSQNARLQISARLQGKQKKCIELEEMLKSALQTSLNTNNQQSYQTTKVTTSAKIQTKNSHSDDSQQKGLANEDKYLNFGHQPDQLVSDQLYSYNKVKNADKTKKYKVDFRIPNEDSIIEGKEGNEKVYYINLPTKSEKAIKSSGITQQQKSKRMKKIMRHTHNSQDRSYDSVKQIPTNSSILKSLQPSSEDAQFQWDYFKLCSKEYEYTFTGINTYKQLVINERLNFSQSNAKQFENSKFFDKNDCKLQSVDEQQQNTKLEFNDHLTKREAKRDKVPILKTVNQNLVVSPNKSQQNSLIKLKRKLKKISNVSSSGVKQLSQCVQLHDARNYYSKTAEPHFFSRNLNTSAELPNGKVNNLTNTLGTNSFSLDCRYQFSPFYELNKVSHQSFKIEERNRKVQTKQCNRKVLNTKKLVMSLHNNSNDKIII